VRRDLLQLLLESRALCRVALGVEEALFLRVQPRPRNAKEKVLRLKLCPVSCCHASAIWPKVEPQ